MKRNCRTLAPRRFAVLGFTLFATLLAGLTALNAQNPAKRTASPPEGVRVERNITYAHASGVDLPLDLYLPDPADTALRPLVVFFHGGGFRGGNKNNPEGIWLVPRGYVIASVEYRLSGIATAPAPIHDAKAAIRWLRLHSKEYGINPERIGVWGTSAGGHLASLVGTSGDVPDLEGDVGVTGPTSRVQAVVNFYGGGDLVETYRVSKNLRKPLALLLGGPLDEHLELARQFSATSYISPDDPPSLFVQGDQDPLVPPVLTRHMHEALLAAGIESTLRIEEGQKHGFKIRLDTESELAQLVAGFLDRHLRP